MQLGWQRGQLSHGIIRQPEGIQGDHVAAVEHQITRSSLPRHLAGKYRLDFTIADRRQVGPHARRGPDGTVRRIEHQPETGVFEIRGPLKREVVADHERGSVRAQEGTQQFRAISHQTGLTDERRAVLPEAGICVSREEILLLQPAAVLAAMEQAARRPRDLSSTRTRPRAVRFGPRATASTKPPGCRRSARRGGS